jgi:HK97 family phage portal protein
VSLRKKAYDLLSNMLGTGGVSTFVFGRPTASGKIVSPGSAMQVTAVWTCIKIISETVGALPFGVFAQNGEKRSPATKHPIHRLMHDEPNPQMSAMDFRMAMTSALCLWGNAYAKIVRRGNGVPIGLYPMPSQLVRPTWNGSNGVWTYNYTPSSGAAQTLDADQVLHIRGMSYDGVNGLSPISLLGNSIGLAMALEEYASRFFSNGGVPSLVLQTPEKLGPDGIRNVRESWKNLYGGIENSNEVAVLEEQMTVKEIGVNPNNAQAVESRKFQLGEIARIYRMPPHMLADLDRATFSNIEQQSLEFVIYTLTPWLRMWEQSVNRQLFSDADKEIYSASFTVDELVRGDEASRASADAVGRQWGWLSANDCRQKRGMNPVEGGDEYLVPMNMLPADGTPAPIPAPTTKKPPVGAPPLPIAAQNQRRIQ